MRTVVALASALVASTALAQPVSHEEVANAYGLCKETIGRCIMPQRGGPTGFCATDSAKNCLEVNRLYIESGAEAEAKQKQKDETVKALLQKAKKQ